MGVRGLQSYLENYCHSAIPVESIEALAKRRREDINEKLTIVVDGLNCIQHIYGGLPWVGGGTFKEYVKKAEAFVEAFRKIGISLIFFFDGPIVPKKLRTYVERRMATFEKAYHVLDVVHEGTSSDVINKHDYFILPPGLYRQTQYILQHILKCEVHQTVLECDEEIAHYAIKNDVFAVLGHDTDFVILDIGQAFYLDSEHLDLETMKTRVYYPKELANSLGLKKGQLALLATLMGNDIVKYDDLKNFHDILMSGKVRNLRILVPKIASYIKSLPDDFLDCRILREMSRIVFKNFLQARDIKASVVSYCTVKGMQDKSKKLEENRRMEKRVGIQQGEKGGWSNNWRSIRRQEGEIGVENRSNWRGRPREIINNWRSIRRKEGEIGVENRSNWRGRPREIINNWREESRREKEKGWLTFVNQVVSMFRQSRLPDNVYAVIKGLPFRSSTSLEDFRISPRDLPIFTELTLELRQRLYGILLHEKPVSLGSHCVQELCMAGPAPLDHAPAIAAVPPRFPHPGLLALWGDRDRPFGQLDNLRWSLLVSSVSPRLDVRRVRQLPPHLVMPALILHHIVNFEGPGRLEQWEAEVVLAAAAVLHRYDEADLALIDQDPMTSRSVRVSNLLMLTSCFFYDLMAACGNPLSDRHTVPSNFFDGRLFQSKYREAEKGRASHARLCDDDAASLAAFRLTHGVVFGYCRN